MEQEAVIFDFNRTLYDPETGLLYPEVDAMLSEMSASRRLFLYSKIEGGREDLLRELGIAERFEKAYFVEQKNAESIRAILETHELSAQGSIIVGDLLTSELAAGREVGLTTIWVRQGKFADTLSDFEPDHTVASIPELRALFTRLA